ncbi:MAG TPA: hypothetical protein VG387_01500 [Rhizomicrobium sp.]|jgi:hypothetical protein|nr:hypothetical protein [Rhizomicrobium sp.]
MATRKTAKTAAKPLAQSKVAVRRKMAPPSPIATFPWRTVAVVVGVAGLAALGSALLGSRRFRDDVARPLSAATLLPLAAAMAPQADRVWAETRPWRDYVGRVLASINTEEVRETVAERLSQWIERFR